MARRLAEEHLTASQRTYPALPLHLYALEVAATVAHLQGDLERTAALWEAYRDQLPPDADRGVQASPLLALADVALRRGEVHDALRRWIEALEALRGQWEESWNLPAVSGIARLAQRIGNPRLAVRLLAAASAWRHRTGVALGAIPGEAAEEAQLTARARESLGEDYEAAWAEGMATPLETLMDEAQNFFERVVQEEEPSADSRGPRRGRLRGSLGRRLNRAGGAAIR